MEAAHLLWPFFEAFPEAFAQRISYTVGDAQRAAPDDREIADMAQRLAKLGGSQAE